MKNLPIRVLVFWIILGCSKDDPKVFSVTIQIENSAHRVVLSDQEYLLAVPPLEEVYIDLFAHPASDHEFTDISNIQLHGLSKNMRASKGWSIPHNRVSYRIYVRNITQDRLIRLSITGSSTPKNLNPYSPQPHEKTTDTVPSPSKLLQRRGGSRNLWSRHCQHSSQ